MQKFVILFVTLSALTACSSFSRRAPNQEMKVVLKDAAGNVKEAPATPTVRDGKELSQIPVEDTHAEAQAVAQNPTEAQVEAQAQAEEMKEAVAAAAQHVQNTHGKAEREAGPVPAEKAFGWLKNGNTRFVKGTFRSDGAKPADRLRLVARQKPHSVIVSCSDSRVPPEVIFDQKLGEIFVIRTATANSGNDIIESIEYAVQQLGTNLVVVLGSEGCGEYLGSNALVESASAELMERSAILRDAIATGEVKVSKALYHLDSGRVEWRP